MTTIIGRYLIRQILVASIAISVIGTGPVILVSLFTQLPGEAIFTSLAWPALASIVPIISYHAFPFLIAVAVVWCYSSFITEGTLTIMQTAGLSPWAVRAPVLVLVIAMTAVGYSLSCVAVPWSSGRLHDVLFSLRHHLNPALLRAGEFNKIDGGRQVIFFDKVLGDGQFGDIFVQEKLADNTEKTYFARAGGLLETDNTINLVLVDGSFQIFSLQKAQTITFSTMSIPVSMFGNSHLQRAVTIVDELGPIGFLAAHDAAFQKLESKRDWLREAFKRFAIPPLTILHSLLGLSLLTLVSMAGRMPRHPVVLVSAVIAATHMALVVAIEQIGVDIEAISIVVAITCAEMALVIALSAVNYYRARRGAQLHRLRLRVARVAAVPLKPVVAYARQIVIARTNGRAVDCRGVPGQFGEQRQP